MNASRILIIVGVAVVLAGGAYFATRHSAPPPVPEKIEWIDFGTACASAPAAHKKILVDVYTDWCVWCKTMDKKTYTDTGVVSYIKEHFIPVKLNAESQASRHVNTTTMTDAQLAGAFGVTGFPTTVFTDDSGTPITSTDGYVEAPQFKTILRYIAEDRYRTMTFEQFRKSGL
jgi:thioredoxin-related protein